MFCLEIKRMCSLWLAFNFIRTLFQSCGYVDRVISHLLKCVVGRLEIAKNTFAFCSLHSFATIQTCDRILLFTY